MAKVDKIKELLEKARDIKSKNAAFYLQFRSDINKEYLKIDQDENLSTAGKIARKKETKKLAEQVLMTQAKQRKEEFSKLVEEAKSHAQTVVNAQLPKPDPLKAQKFEQALANLKTELMLATNLKTAETKLNDFLAQIDEPAFNAVVRDQFAELLTPIVELAGPQAPQVKQKLFDRYESVKLGAMTDEQREANELLETADAMLNAPMFDLAVLRAVNDDFDAYVAEYMNKPEQYEPRDDDEKVAPAQVNIEAGQLRAKIAAGEPLTVEDAEKAYEIAKITGKVEDRAMAEIVKRYALASLEEDSE